MNDAPASPSPSFRLARGSRRQAWFWWTLLGLALPLRLLWVGSEFYREHAWNEGHYACATLNLSRYGLLDQRSDLNPDRTFSPLVPALLWPLASLAQWRPWGFRLPLVVSGLVTLGAFYGLLRWRWGVTALHAWLALLLAASAPGIVYFSRNLQLDGPATAFLFLALLGVSSPTRGGRGWGWLCWALCVLAKTSFLLYWPAILVAAALRAGAVGSPRWRWGWAAALSLLTLLPIMGWSAYCIADSAGGFAGFLARSSHRTLPNVFHALYKTRDILWRHLGPAILLLGAVGLLAFWRGRERLSRPGLLVAGWLGGSWVIFIFSHPRAYYENQYYTYPGLYMACLLAAWGVTETGAALARRLHRRSVSGLLLGLLALSVLINVEEYIRHFGIIYIRPSVILEALGRPPAQAPKRLYSTAGVDVFAEARTLATQAPAGKKVLVDYPSTMFYAGGDPARVRCAYGPVSAAFNPRVDGAVLLNLVADGRPHEDETAFVARLAALGWRRVSPRAWVAPR